MKGRRADGCKSTDRVPDQGVGTTPQTFENSGEKIRECACTGRRIEPTVSVARPDERARSLNKIAAARTAQA